MYIEGNSLEFVENLKPIDIDNKLGKLPDDHKHSVELANFMECYQKI